MADREARCFMCGTVFHTHDECPKCHAAKA
jgi:hypothetical protein